MLSTNNLVTDRAEECTLRATMTEATSKKQGFKKCRSATFSIDGFSFTIGKRLFVSVYMHTNKVCVCNREREFTLLHCVAERICSLLKMSGCSDYLLGKITIFHLKLNASKCASVTLMLTGAHVHAQLLQTDTFSSHITSIFNEHTLTVMTLGVASRHTRF